LIGFALTIKFYNSENEIETNFVKNFFNPASSENNTVNLIIIFNLHTNKEEKIFYSFSKITHMILLGNDESLILAGKLDGTLDIFDLNSIEEKFYGKFPNLNNLKLASLNLTEILEYNFNSIISIKTRLVDIVKKSSRIYVTDAYCKLIIFEFSDDKQNLKNLKFLRKITDLEFKQNLERIFNIDIGNIHELPENHNLFIIDLKIKSDTTAMEEKFYILTNFGLATINFKTRDEIIYKSIIENKSEINKLVSFDISESNLIILAFSDSTIKIYQENTMNFIFQTAIPNVTIDSVITQILWSDVVCKNDKNNLIRHKLNANFYVLTTKNELLIFDLNQKTKNDIKVKHLIHIYCDYFKCF
jgi:hypothetical protein